MEKSHSGLLVEGAGIIGLGIVLAYFLASSWRKWPDPLIDFGRELYLPWRISEGALLFRDIEGHYGPLSQYFNSLLFACFGPGLMVLVTANLLLFTGILAVVYLLCRRAWDWPAAFTATVIFISVFGFSQLTGIANYNYATPYAHETTHGLLVSLGLVLVLVHWIPNPTPWLSLGAGSLYGLSAVLKPEFVLGGALVSLGALALRWRYYSFPGLTSISAAILGVVLPTLAFTSYFAAFVPLHDAFNMAAHAWLRFATTTQQGAAAGIQGGFSGLDKAGNHLFQHAFATFIACLLIGGVAGLAWLMSKVSRLSLFIVLGVAAATGLAWLSWTALDWPEVGRCLLGLLLIYIAAQFCLLLFKKTPPQNLNQVVSRILLAILGSSLMARMALNGRIYHYGFYQAAIAGSILPAILIGELPEWLRLKAREHAFVFVAIAALLIPGVAMITRNSQALLRTKTVPVGEGVDRFYAFSRQMEPTGEIVAGVVQSLKKTGEVDSLLVLPEGIMINYLARISSTVPSYFFAATNPQLVAELEKRPPERVVLISRDLREYGLERYGAKAGSGQELIQWLSQNYRQIGHVGGDPLDVKRQRGAVIFRRKSVE